MLGVKKGNFFRNLFFMFFLMMNVLLLAFLAILFGQWTSEQAERQRQENQSQASLISRMLDEKFSAADLISQQVTSSYWLKYASARSDLLYSQVDYQRRQEICQTIGNHNDSLRIARSTAVLLPYRNIAVDRRSFWESRRYFRSVGLPGDMLLELQAQLEGRYGSMVLFANDAMRENNSSFAAIKNLEYGDNTDKVLFLYIDGKLFDTFVKNMGSSLAGLEIYSGEDCVYAWGETEEEGLYRERVESDAYNCSYRILLKTEKSMPSPGILLLLLAGLIAAVALEFAIALRLADWGVRPVGKLMERLEIRGFKKETMLDDIEASWNSLSEEKDWMETLGNQYYQIAESVYLASLLTGTFERDTAREHAEKFHLPFQETMHCKALVFSYLGNDRKEFQESMLKLGIQCYRDNISAVFFQEESVLLLVSAQGEEMLIQQEERIRMLLDEMAPELEAEVHSGKVHTGFEGISRSFKEGKEKQYVSRTGGSAAYYYPLDLEMNLIHSMRMGKFEQAGELIGQLRQENEARTLLPREQKRVVSLVFEVLWRFAVDAALPLAEIEEDFSHATEEEGQTQQALWDSLEDAFSRIHAAYLESNETKGLGRELVAYVDAHYTEAELSQQDIADAFGISRPVVSRVFKETTQMNFVDYLRKRRVEQACFCFNMGEKNVMEAARKSGYADELTFRRAFMRCVGMTPKDYVKKWNDKTRKE